MFRSLFCRRWRTASTCKQLLQQLQSRLKLLISKKHELSRDLRSDIVILIQYHASNRALRRTEDLVLVNNSIIVYELLLRFTNYIIFHIPYIEKHRKLFNSKIKEAVSSLVFASASCGEQLRELVIIRELFSQRYGQSYITKALQLLPRNHVNLQVKEILSLRSVSEGAKSKLFNKIAKKAEAARYSLLDGEYDHLLEVIRLKYTPEIDKQVNVKEEKKVMVSDLNCCSDKQSPDEAYKFSLTDFEGEMRREEKLLEDDYIKEAQVAKDERVLRSRESSQEERRSSSLSDEIAEEYNRRLEVLRLGWRLGYTPEIDKQVNKEEGKRVKDLNSCSDEQSPDEAYKFSLMDFEEEIRKEERSMEHDYIEEAQVGKDERVLIFREERRSSSSSSKLLTTQMEEKRKTVSEGAKKSRLVDERAKEYGHRSEVMRLKYTPEVDKQVNKKEEKSMKDDYLEEAQVAQYQRVLRFRESIEEERRSSSSSSSSLNNSRLLKTQTKEKVSKISLSEDVKSRLLDEIAREPGRLLKKPRREYTPEIDKQVNEEGSDEQSPDEVYKSSLSDFKEEIRKEERSMEDDYIDEAQVGKDQRVFRFKERSEDKRRSSSSSAPLLSIKELCDMESITYYKKRKRTHQRRTRSSMVYNEFGLTKEGKEDRQKAVTNTDVHSQLSVCDQMVNQIKAVKAKEEEERQRLVLKHVHPRLPDYDQLVTEMKAVKKNEEERRRLATQHVHPKLPDYDQLVTYFKGLKKQQCMRS